MALGMLGMARQWAQASLLVMRVLNVPWQHWRALERNALALALALALAPVRALAPPQAAARGQRARAPAPPTAAARKPVLRWKPDPLKQAAE